MWVLFLVLGILVIPIIVMMIAVAAHNNYSDGMPLDSDSVKQKTSTKKYSAKCEKIAESAIDNEKHNTSRKTQDANRELEKHDLESKIDMLVARKVFPKKKFFLTPEQCVKFKDTGKQSLQYLMSLVLSHIGLEVVLTGSAEINYKTQLFGVSGVAGSTDGNKIIVNVKD